MTNSANPTIAVKRIVYTQLVEDLTLTAGDWELTTVLTAGELTGQVFISDAQNGYVLSAPEFAPIHALLAHLASLLPSEQPPVEVELPEVEPTVDGSYWPPMWGLWLIDPSGKYGWPHKVFAMTGDTAEEAFRATQASYKPFGKQIELDQRHTPYVINPARGQKPA